MLLFSCACAYVYFTSVMLTRIAQANGSKRFLRISLPLSSTLFSSGIKMSRFFSTSAFFLTLLALFNLHPAQAPSTPRWRNLKTKFSLRKPMERFPSTLRGINLKVETVIGRFGFVFEQDHRILEKLQF